MYTKIIMIEFGCFIIHFLISWIVSVFFPLKHKKLSFCCLNGLPKFQESCQQVAKCSTTFCMKKNRFQFCSLCIRIYLSASLAGFLSLPLSEICSSVHQMTRVHPETLMVCYFLNN